MGTSSETIGTAGCLVTCVASMLTDWDTRIEPGDLNDWLNLHDGYVKGNRFVWSSVQPLGARVEEHVACATTPAPLQQFADALAAGRAVLAMVDWEPGGKIDTHWVSAVAERDGPGETAIMDPWQPTPELAITTLEEHYCQEVLGCGAGDLPGGDL